MKDLTNPNWIKLKGILFLAIGIISALMLLLQYPDWRVAALLAISIWCFCRFYYFAFYVIQNYVDGTFKFSGLWSFACWFFANRRKR